MGWLVAVIPIACCVLIPAGLALVAFFGLGKKDKSISGSPDNEALPPAVSRFSTSEEPRRK